MKKKNTVSRLCGISIALTAILCAGVNAGKMPKRVNVVPTTGNFLEQFQQKKFKIQVMKNYFPPHVYKCICGISHALQHLAALNRMSTSELNTEYTNFEDFARNPLVFLRSHIKSHIYEIQHTIKNLNLKVIPAAEKELHILDNDPLLNETAYMINKQIKYINKNMLKLQNTLNSRHSIVGMGEEQFIPYDYELIFLNPLVRNI